MLIHNQFIVFYVSHVRNVCFPVQKHTFPYRKTYVSVSGNIERNKALFYYCLCFFTFAYHLIK